MTRTAMSEELIVGTSNVLSIPLLNNEVADTPVTGATVNLTLYDVEDDSEIGGVVWPQAMAHVADGLYRYVAPATLEITHNQRVRGVAVAVDPASTYQATIVNSFVALDRECP